MGTTFLATQRSRSAANSMRLPENTNTVYSHLSG